MWKRFIMKIKFERYNTFSCRKSEKKEGKKKSNIPIAIPVLTVNFVLRSCSRLRVIQTKNFARFFCFLNHLFKSFSKRRRTFCEKSDNVTCVDITKRLWHIYFEFESARASNRLILFFAKSFFPTGIDFPGTRVLACCRCASDWWVMIVSAWTFDLIFTPII